MGQPVNISGKEGREEGKGRRGGRNIEREGRRKGELCHAFFRDSITVTCLLKISVHLHANVLH